MDFILQRRSVSLGKLLKLEDYSERISFYVDVCSFNLYTHLFIIDV